jgi:hypothetical protein
MGLTISPSASAYRSEFWRSGLLEVEPTFYAVCGGGVAIKVEFPT